MPLFFLCLFCFFMMENCFALSASAKTIDDELDAINKQWLETFNKKQGNIREYYTQNALFFPEKEVFFTGEDAITPYFQSLSLDNVIFNEAKVSYRVRLHDMVYELGTLMSTDDTAYCYLVVWQKIDHQWYRDLQAIAIKSAETQDYTEIDKARERWMQLSNAHSAIELIQRMYTLDCVYYNQETIYKGLEEVTRVYGYMNHPTFSIQLTKLAGAVVQQDLAYEIGQYKSNGNVGNYMIIWSKQPNGEWKIQLDTNW